MDIKQIIAEFGGPAKLADHLNRMFPDDPVSRSAVYKWRERGSLPLVQLNKLAKLANSLGKPFDINRYLVADSTRVLMESNVMNNRIYIFDTTLRDGEQSPGAAMTPEAKMRVARQLERLGVDVIEAGFAAASPGDAEAVNAVAKAIQGSTICSLARANERDVRIAGEALTSAPHGGRIHVFIATSPIHMEKKLRMTPDQVVSAAVNAVKIAGEYTKDIEFSAEDAGRSDPEFLIRVFGEVIKAGAKVINVPDTVGYSIPSEWYARLKFLIDKTPCSEQVIWSTHCHDDLGMSVANSLAAVQAGVRQVECTINGLGERAGNTSLEEVVMALKTRRDLFNVELGIDTTQILQSSRLVSSITGYPVQPNKAIVGANAFSHASGIHQDGVLKNRETYEIMTAESVGWAANRLTMGKLSGRNALKTKLAELGIELDSEEALNAAFARFKELADRKREVFDEDLLTLVSDELTQSIQEQYKFISLRITTETGEQPQAEIVFSYQGEEQRAVSGGSGPVDAVFLAIEKVVKSQANLGLYSVNAITEGTDSQGEVTVRLERGEHVVNGQGADTDILVASAKAYLAALNRLENMCDRIDAQRGV